MADGNGRTARPGLVEPTARSRLAERSALLWRSQEEKGDQTVRVDGADFVVRPGVFSPKYFESTHVFARMLPPASPPRVLDVGTGSGALAILLALRGAEQVVASDISRAAIENAALNVARHGLDEVVRVVQSDLFDQLAGERFDCVIWNAPWICAPEDLRPNELELSICDPGYQALRRFLAGAKQMLRPGGLVHLGLGSIADRPRLIEMARRQGLRELSVQFRRSLVDPTLEFSLHTLGN